MNTFDWSKLINATWLLTFSIAYQIQVILDCPTLCSIIPFKMYQNIQHNLQSVYAVYNQWAWIQSLTLYFRDKEQNLRILFIPPFLFLWSNIITLPSEVLRKVPLIHPVEEDQCLQEDEHMQQTLQKEDKSLVLPDLFQHFSNFCYSNLTSSSVILKHGK